MTPLRFQLTVLCMRFLRQKLQGFLRARESLRLAEQFHAESRARVEALAAAGRARVALEENAALFGTTSAERPRLVSFKGIRV